MADGINFDLSELTQLAADLGDVPDNVGPLINSAIQFTSVNVKEAAQKSVGRRKHFKGGAAGIDYEVNTLQAFGVSVIKSDIGYNKDTDAGKLGNLIEFGAPGSKNALAPTSDLANALHANEADFERGLKNALIDAEKRSGL